MSWFTGAMLRDLKSRNRCWGRTIGRCITGARNSRVLLARVGRGFGADSHQKHVPTASDMWATGERFAKLWNVTLQKNFESFVTGGSGPSGWTRCGRQCGTGMTTIKVMA